MNSCTVALTILEVTLIELTITHQNFNLTIYDFIALESCLYYFVGDTK
jgi:hypothetical protein